MNDKIPSQTEVESAGFSPYGTSVKINSANIIPFLRRKLLDGNESLAVLARVQVFVPRIFQLLETRIAPGQPADPLR